MRLRSVVLVLSISSIILPQLILLRGVRAQSATDSAAVDESKRPVLGAACPYCPWGALAEKIRTAMAPLGYDVQICYNCSGLNSIPIVADRLRPPPLSAGQRDLPVPPDRPVDFGVVNLDFFTDAYRGIGRYRNAGPRLNLRLIARVEDPNYYLVATRVEAFITDLRQIKEKHLPVRMLLEGSIRSEMILKYYEIDREELQSWGGSIVSTEPANRQNFDVVISFANSLNNTPESNVWYELSQRANLRFLQLPDDLLQSLAAASDWEIGMTPVQLMRGMDKPIKTVLTSGTVVYGRADMPDQLAYDVAKALDQSKHALVFSIIPFSYNPDIEWQARRVPLHPGAERYYREKGYVKVSASGAKD